MSEPTDRERALTERNKQLSATLLEARDQLVAGKTAIDGLARSEAINEALDYAILAVDMRIDVVKRSIGQGAVGTEKDPARRLPGAAIADIFETALRGYGYQIVRDPQAK